MNSPVLTLALVSSALAAVPAAARADVAKATTGQTITLTAYAEGSAPFDYQWYKDDLPLPDQRGQRLVVDYALATDAGTYAVTVSNSRGSLRSSPVVIDVVNGPAKPKVLGLPGLTELKGGAVTLQPAVKSATAVTGYQWYLNGLPVAGATSPTLAIDATNAAGVYQLAATNETGTAWSGGARVVTERPTESRVVNFSIRSLAKGEAAPLIVGYSSNSPVDMPVLLRAIGPGLVPFGLTDAMVDPRLVVYRGQSAVEANDNWATEGASGLFSGLFSSVGAFALADPGSLDAVKVVRASGARTVHVFAQRGTGAGVVLIEAYDLAKTKASSLTNISAQNEAGSGDATLIVGFVIEGDRPLPILIRGIGPGLAPFGVPNTLADPALDLYRGDEWIAGNEDWGGGAGLAEDFARAGAFSLKANSRDAALSLLLAPGIYTAHVTSPAGTTGRAMIEVYALTSP